MFQCIQTMLDGGSSAAVHFFQPFHLPMTRFFPIEKENILSKNFQMRRHNSIWNQKAFDVKKQDVLRNLKCRTVSLLMRQCADS